MYTRGQRGSDGELVIGFFKWQCKIDEWRGAGAVVAWMEM